MLPLGLIFSYVRILKDFLLNMPYLVRLEYNWKNKFNFIN